jgi:hypothetical protein
VPRSEDIAPTTLSRSVSCAGRAGRTITTPPTDQSSQTTSLSRVRTLTALYEARDDAGEQVRDPSGKIVTELCLYRYVLIVLCLLTTSLGCRGGTPPVKAAPDPLETIPTRWIDLPEAPFVARVVDGKALLVSRTGQHFDWVESGCVADHIIIVWHVAPGSSAIRCILTSCRQSSSAARCSTRPRTKVQ